jgi:hypothetical protein
VQPPPTKELKHDPCELYIYAIIAPATKAKYRQRLRAFLEFIGYNDPQMPIEERARAFAARPRGDTNYAFGSLLQFFQMQRERLDRKEIAIGTVRNHAKAINPFYDMACSASSGISIKVYQSGS